MIPRGGTEILTSNLYKYVEIDLLNKVNLIVSSCKKESLSNSFPNLLWQHLNTNEENVKGMNCSDFVRQIDKFIFVSNWQMNKFHNNFYFPIDKSMVIKNAIEPIEYIKKPTNKIKLIYTSTPWRGLNVLLDAFELINRNDVELDVYSSTIIYGKYFAPNAFDWLFNRCKMMKNVNYKGYALNNAIRKAVQKSHIFAYPSIFEETSCVSAIEAGAAGCKIVTTNYGALQETCNSYATYVEYSDNLVQDYAEVLNNVIDNYCDDAEQQSRWFNNTYSWINRKKEWNNLLENL